MLVRDAYGSILRWSPVAKGSSSVFLGSWSPPRRCTRKSKGFLPSEDAGQLSASSKHPGHFVDAMVTYQRSVLRSSRRAKL